MISSLRVRMMIAVGLLAVAAVVAVAWAARVRTRTEFRHFQELEKHSDTTSAVEPEVISAVLMRRCCDAAAVHAAAEKLSSRQVLVVVDSAGEIIAKAGKPFEKFSEVQFLRDGAGVTLQAEQREHGAVVSDVALRFQVNPVAVRMTSGDNASLYVLPFPDEGNDRPAAVFLGSIDRSLLIATAMVAALALLVTWTLTRRIVGPIEELRFATRDLAAGKFGRRVETRGSDEIAELGRSFNAMAAELEHQQALRRNLVNDVVHELRTPLTALRCRLDSVTDGVSADPRKEIGGANEEIDYLARLVEDLHELALAEAGELKFSIAEAALKPIVESAARAAGLDADARLSLQVDENLVVRADAVRLRQVVLNLLSNAARHTPADGTISVRGFRREFEVVTEIHNTGSQLAAEELARVFDRFYRADPSRQRATGGTGLGLAIVKQLVEAQGGHVWAESDGSGVKFGFALPG